MKKDYSKIIIIALIIIILIIAFLLLKDTLFPNPILKINGNEYVEHNLYDEYQDLGFSLDHGDSTKVQVNSNVDVTKEGIYDVIYTYKDQVITRHVEVKKINVLNLIGDKDVYLLINGEYTDPKVEAIVNKVDSSNEVKVNSDLNTKEAGDYKITYSLNDKTVERNIHVSNFDEYFKINYSNSDLVDKLELEISIDKDKVSKYSLPDKTEKDDNSTFTITKNGNYAFTIYDKYNNKYDKRINITNVKVEPIEATCTAVVEKGKTTINVKANKTITKYIYNGVVSNKDNYVFEKVIKENKVMLYDDEEQFKEITCTTDLSKAMELQIHFIKPGKVYDDAILIRTDNTTIFIDGGRADVEVTKYLKDVKVDKIDYLIGSHLHYDHVGAHKTIVKSFKVGKVIYPDDIYNCSGGRCKRNEMNRVVSALNSKNIKAETLKIPNIIDLGDMKLYFIAPWKIISNENDNSFIFILEYGNNKFMFNGDSYGPLNTIDTLTANAKKLGLKDIKVDLTKYAHHGCEVILDKFLDATSPKYIIVPNNGSPQCPVSSNINRIKAHGIKMYRQTDSKTGNILITSDGDNIKIKMDINPTDYAK